MALTAKLFVKNFIECRSNNLEKNEEDEDEEEREPIEREFTESLLKQVDKKITAGF